MQYSGRNSGSSSNATLVENMMYAKNSDILHYFGLINGVEEIVKWTPHISGSRGTERRDGVVTKAQDDAMALPLI